MAFEEQFSQISEFAQAKIALEQENMRRRKLDRIADETRERQTALYEVQLQEAKQAAQSTQMKLDAARLEQKHTSNLASAWVAMMDETDSNETAARKGAGTGWMTTTIGSREQTASLTPDGRVVVGASSLRPMEDTGLGGDNRVLFQAENGSGWVEDPTGVRVRVPEPSYTVQYIVPGASSTAKDAYRKALIDAAREAPASIQIFSQISEAFVRQQNLPEYLKLSNESMRALTDTREGKLVGTQGMSLEDQNRQADLYRKGHSVLIDAISPEKPSDIQKRGDDQTELIKNNQSALASSINQKLGMLALNAEIAPAVLAKATGPAADAAAMQALLESARSGVIAAKRSLDPTKTEGKAYEAVQQEIARYSAGIAELGKAKLNTDANVQSAYKAQEFGLQLYHGNLEQGMPHVIAAQRAAEDAKRVAVNTAVIEKRLLLDNNPATEQKRIDEEVQKAYGSMSSPEAMASRRILMSQMMGRRLNQLYGQKAPEGAVQPMDTPAAPVVPATVVVSPLVIEPAKVIPFGGPPKKK